jgi:hypothetical protein
MSIELVVPIGVDQRVRVPASVQDFLGECQDKRFGDGWGLDKDAVVVTDGYAVLNEQMGKPFSAGVKHLSPSLRGPGSRMMARPGNRLLDRSGGNHRHPTASR